MLCAKQRCTGCAACAAACPRGAIQMVPFEGFFFPEICKQDCTQCGLCAKACPVLSYKGGGLAPAVYQGVHVDDAVRQRSASGGLFSAIAAYFFERGGFVCASVFGSDHFLRMTLSDDPAQLAAMRGTRYVQSLIDPEIFRKIKGLLEDKKSVFFIGTPCQTAALKTYLGKSYYSLLCADIVCHGVPSPLLFADYCGSIGDVCGVNFREKGHEDSPRLTFTDKQGAVLHTAPLFSDPFGHAFGASLITRACCGDCRFTGVPRVGDLTLGDFWGAETVGADKDEVQKGLSMVAVNSVKGADILRHLEPYAQLTRRDVATVAAYNPRFMTSARSNPLRGRLFAGYEKRGYRYVYKKYLSLSLWKRIYRKLGALIGK